MRDRYTKHEDNIIMSDYHGHMGDIKAIAEKLGRSCPSVQGRISRLRATDVLVVAPVFNRTKNNFYGNKNKG